jgi:hypothetical protein
MSPGEGGVLFSVLFAIGVHAIFGFGLYFWGRWVARRRGSAGWRRASLMPLFALGLAALGVVIPTVMMLGAFSDVASVEASHKAAVLARSISEAMNLAALFALPSALLYLASLVSFIVGSVGPPAPPRPPLLHPSGLRPLGHPGAPAE